MSKLEWFGHELPDGFFDGVMEDLQKRLARRMQIKKDFDALNATWSHEEFRKERFRKEYQRMAQELEDKAMSEEERKYTTEDMKGHDEEGKIPELPECPFPDEENPRLDDLIYRMPLGFWKDEEEKIMKDIEKYLLENYAPKTIMRLIDWLQPRWK